MTDIERPFLEPRDAARALDADTEAVLAAIHEFSVSRGRRGIPFVDLPAADGGRCRRVVPAAALIEWARFDEDGVPHPPWPRGIQPRRMRPRRRPPLNEPRW